MFLLLEIPQLHIMKFYKVLLILLLLNVFLKLGRTHQIRVHMAHIGHPLLSDTLYGASSHLIYRQALHAYRLSYIHPISSKRLTLTAPIPSDFKFVNIKTIT